MSKGIIEAVSHERVGAAKMRSCEDTESCARLAKVVRYLTAEK
jgi:hypothetical protein